MLYFQAMRRFRVGVSFCALVLMTTMGFTGLGVAAACVPSADYGTVTYTVPTMPTSAPYTIWSRLNVADTTDNSYFLEIADNTSKACFKVGDSASLQPGQWQWVDY